MFPVLHPLWGRFYVPPLYHDRRYHLDIPQGYGALLRPPIPAAASWMHDKGLSGHLCKCAFMLFHPQMMNQNFAKRSSNAYALTNFSRPIFGVTSRALSLFARRNEEVHLFPTGKRIVNFT